MIYISADSALMQQTIDGDKEAFEILVLKHRESAIGFAYTFLADTHTSEDIVQESFVSIYISRNSYKPKNTFKTFLFAIVRNKCIDFIRKNKNYSFVNLENITISSKEPTPYELIEREEILRQSTELLNKLNQNYRTAFSLYEMDGFSYKEIAEIMNKSLPQIKIIIYRARKKLKSLVKEHADYEN